MGGDKQPTSNRLQYFPTLNLAHRFVASAGGGRGGPGATSLRSAPAFAACQ